MKIRTLKLTITATFIAIGVAIGYALVFFPNIELVTLVIFLGGYHLGWRSGVFIGVTTEFIYSNFNLFGPAPLHILAAQVCGMLLVGFTGGLIQKYIKDLQSDQVAKIILAGMGILLTMTFDFLTTVADIFVIEASRSFLVARLVVGSPFFIAHGISNLLIFYFLAPVMIQNLQKLPSIERLKNQMSTTISET